MSGRRCGFHSGVPDSASSNRARDHSVHHFLTGAARKYRLARCLRRVRRVVSGEFPAFALGAGLPTPPLPVYYHDGTTDTTKGSPQKIFLDWPKKALDFKSHVH